MSEVMKTIRIDILSNLPTELCQEILKYLPGEDLAQCTMVSRSWRNISNNNKLWKRLCTLEGFDLEEEIPQLSDVPLGIEPPCHYKRLYTLHAAVLQKWRDNSFNVLNLENAIATAYFSNGVALVVMYWDGHMDVFDLSGSPKLIQSLSPLIPGSLISFSIRNENYVMFRCYQMFLCYRWSDNMLNFFGALYALQNEDGGTEIRATNESDLMFYLTMYKDTFWDAKALIGDILVLYVRQELTLYFWSLDESRCVGMVFDVKNPDCNVYKKHLFICDQDFLSIYNVHGRMLKSVDFGRPRYRVHHTDLQFNDYIILSVMNGVQGISTMKAWTWKLKKTVEFDEKLHGIVIHPRLPAVIYLSQYGRQRCTCRIVMRDLRQAAILWEAPFPTCKPFGTIREEFVYFNVIKEKYLLCVPRYESCFTSNERLLYNIKNGKKMYHIRNEDQFIVNYSNNNLIEVTVYGVNRVHVATRIILYN